MDDDDGAVTRFDLFVEGYLAALEETGVLRLYKGNRALMMAADAWAKYRIRTETPA